MAKKKENKYVGYLVISIIPIIGIVWAVVAGIVHNGYVKSAQKEEIAFENQFKTELNKLNDYVNKDDQDNKYYMDKAFPAINEDLNVTNAKLTSYDNKLLFDDVNTSKSYTITLGANPTITDVNILVSNVKVSSENSDTTTDITGTKISNITCDNSSVILQLTNNKNDFDETFTFNNSNSFDDDFNSENLNKWLVNGEFNRTDENSSTDRLSFDENNNGTINVTSSDGTIYSLSFSWKSEDVVSFGLTFEFYISGDEYEDICEYYTKDTTQTIGTKQYIYEHYNSNSPKRSPVAKLLELFNKHKSDINYFEYKKEIYIGLTSKLVRDMIDDIDLTQIKYETKEKLLDQIMTSYNLLTKEQQAEVTNFDKYNEALSIWQVKEVEYYIDKLPKPEDIKRNDDYDIKQAEGKYDKLTDEQKQQVNEKSYQNMLECRQMCILRNLENLFADSNNNNLNKLLEGNDIKQGERQSVKNAVNYYNSLDDEHKAMFKQLDNLKAVVELYNKLYSSDNLELN